MGSRSSIFEDVMELPWQVGAVLAVLCYPGALILSGILSGSPILRGASIVPLMLWPFISIMFGMAAVFAYLRQRKARELVQNNRSIDQIRRLTWRQFEKYVGEAFRQKGYFVVETPEGPDGGVDLVLRKGGEKTYVQCKHWKAYKVSVEKVRALLGSLTAGGADHGVLVTTGNFTSSAKAFAKQHGVTLINGDALQKLIEVDGAEDVQETARNEAAPQCPRCNSAMILRTAKKGPNKGNQFWGCPKFPACRGTRTI